MMMIAGDSKQEDSLVSGSHLLLFCSNKQSELLQSLPINIVVVVIIMIII